jgi:hypothetical protein
MNDPLESRIGIAGYWDRLIIAFRHLALALSEPGRAELLPPLIIQEDGDNCDMRRRGIVNQYSHMKYWRCK